MTKTLRGKLWEDVTTQQRHFNNELTGFALYGVLQKLRTRTPRWFPDPWCRTSNRQPTPSGPTTCHHDRDRRRRRQTKTEAEDGGRWRRTHSGDERTGSSLTADDTPQWTQNLILPLSCDPLTPEPMKAAAVSAASRGTVPVFSFLNLLSGKSRIVKRWQFPQVVPSSLTED